MLSLNYQQLQRKAFPVDEYANPDDFAPVFELLQAAYPGQTVDDLTEDAWAEPLVFKGKELLKTADDLRSNSSVQEAIAYYMWVLGETTPSLITKLTFT